MNTAVADLLVNLKSGIGLCRFKKLGPENFRISADQVVLLFLVGLLIGITSGYLENLPNPEFNSYAVTNEGFSVAAMLFSAYLIGRFILHRQITTALVVLILSTGPVFLLTWQLVELANIDVIGGQSGYVWIYWIYLLWLLAVVFWCIRTVAGSATIRTGVAFVLMLFTWVAPVFIFAANDSFWYPGETGDGDDPYKAYRDLNAERMLFSQPELLEHQLSALKPGRDGVIDVYFIGLGAYARQDVFLKETLYARDLFDRRFGTQGRSITLINHLSTRKETPLATATNLERTLQHIGTLMNRDEDILTLYMTSHGSEKHRFSVSFWPLPLNDITPDMLRDYLDASGIKWRVVMVSACYSGGFIAPLQTPFSAIATAAAPDRTSFGCSNENDFTYFGEALLKDQFQNEHSFQVAFARASVAISLRESKEKLTASNPQYVIGNEIGPLLDTLSEELRALDLPLTGAQAK